MLIPPRRLRVPHRRFSLEEAASVLRHDARNKVASIRNAAFYLRRQIERHAASLTERDPRVTAFLGLIDSELVGIESVLSSRLPPLPEPRPTRVDAGVVAVELVDDLSPPDGIAISVSGSAPIEADRIELELAMFCLIENAVDSIALAKPAGGRVDVRVGGAAIAVDDDGPGFDPATRDRAFEPFFTTRPDRMGLGLKIARRIAARFGGDVDVGPGARARLVLVRGEDR